MIVARSEAELEALRPQFARLPSESLDSDLDFVLTVVAHRDTVLNPHVILLELPGGRELRIVARLEQHRSRRLRPRPLRVLRLAHGGVAGIESEADCELVVQTLREQLAEGVADVAVLPMLEQGGDLYRAARIGAPWWRTDHQPVTSVHWSADVPESLDAYIAARPSRTRANLRRRRKKLLAEHGERLTVREFRAPDELQQLLDDIEAIAAKTYQRGLGVGFTGDRLQQELLALAAREGWLRAQVCYVDGTPIAYIYGYHYGAVFHGSATGFDPDYRNFGVGLYIQMQLMDSLCREGVTRSWDYGAGDAEYKQELADRERHEAEVMLFGPSLRAARFNIARAIRTVVIRGARRWVANSRSGARVKKAWRDHAARRARERLNEG